MVPIKVKVIATHKSETVDIKDTDGMAQLIDLGGIRRLVYQEGCGAITTLDIGNSWVQFKRDNGWITQAIFSEVDESKLLVISEEGELRFDINVLQLETLDDRVIIHYELKQNYEVIDTHVFTCIWSKEEEIWLEIH